MPGLFHLVFGIIVGLAFWKFSEDRDGQKRWSITLVFVFAINNYTGPDLGNVIKKAARALQSEALFKFGSLIHSYLGWVLFTILYAPLWYLFVKGFERIAIKNSDGESKPPVHHSYSDVYLAVLFGGIMHHFTDLVGHSDDIDGVYRVHGRMALWPAAESEILLLYFAFLGILIAVLLLNHFKIQKLAKQDLLPRIRAFVGNPKNQKVMIALVIGVANAAIMYAILVMADLLDFQPYTFKWSGNSINILYFNWGNAMEATHEYEPGAATWFSALAILFLVIGFLIAHLRKTEIRVWNRTLRLEFVVFAAFLGLMTIGYLLQPLIGNISGQEYDFGAFIGLWSTVGYTLVFVATIKGTLPPDSPRKIEVESPSSAPGEM